MAQPRVALGRTGARRLLTFATGAALVGSALWTAAPSTAAPSIAAPSSTSSSATQRFLVVAQNAGSFSAVQQKVTALGGQVVDSVPQLNVLSVRGSAAARKALAADGAVAGIGAEQLRTISIADPTDVGSRAPGLRSAQTLSAPAATSSSRASGVKSGINPDPAFDFPGLQWDLPRIAAPTAWKRTAGDPGVTVAVADTGLDFTHRELASKVSHVEDLSDPSICKDYFTLDGKHVSDFDLAKQYGGPATGDWNGHGSWIGGNIAGALNGTGLNGIAPKVNLVALKISGWCGSASDLEIIKSFLYAADHNIDVVSISFGGYIDRRDPDQNTVYNLYAAVVQYARARGTVIAASAGNEGLRIGAGGKVVSHGPLTAPGAAFQDYYGLYETPGGLPGVVNVSATNNRVVASSSNCLPSQVGSATDTSATCKPKSDKHQAAGTGKQDQLAYYSNYGPRIDLAAPGGARKFNLPVWDRGGTPGFPYTNEDLTNVWEDFSITSNWAIEIPCFTFTKGSAFPPNQCYTAIQGTSMAAPHVSAGLALVASANPSMRHNPAALVSKLKSLAADRHNETRAISATDKSPGDLTGVACTTGYCHLTGPRISDRDAYGAGFLQVARP